MIDAEGANSGKSDDDIPLIYDAKPASRPSAPRRTVKVCQVCKDSSKSKSYNYGALTCLNCKLFFRRCIRMQQDKQVFTCGKNSSCVISRKARNRRLCRFCRYKKCLAVGMVPSSCSEEMETLSIPLDGDPAESTVRASVKTEQFTSGDTWTGVKPMENVLDDREAEDATLPTEDSIVTNLQLEEEWEDDTFTLVKKEVLYSRVKKEVLYNNTNCMDTSTAITQNDNIPLNNEDSDDEMPLSTLKFKPAMLKNSENSLNPFILSVKSELPLHNDEVINEPLVYTTRIDDMIALNNFHSIIDKKELFTNISIESKPKFKPYTHTHCRSRTYSESQISFNNLVEKLNTINTKLSHKPIFEAYDDPTKSSNVISNTMNLSERSKNLLQLCKPLSIPLEDFHKTFIKKSLKTDANSSCKTDIGIPSIKQITIDQLTTSKAIISRKSTLNSKKSYLILNDLANDVLEFYLVDGWSVVLQYYSYNATETDLLYQYSLRNKIDYKLTEYCCWYKREEEIKLFCSKKHMRIPLFMKARHGCKGANCTCCCKSYKHGIESVLNIDDALVFCPKTILKSLYTSHNICESQIIETVLQYSPSTPEKEKKSFKIEQVEIAALYLSNATIQIQNLKNNENEYYELGANGEVVTYLKPYTIHQFSKTQDENSYISKTNIKRFTYCCWFERENIISQLAFMEVSPQTLVFMKTPHSCRLDNCCCCCKLLKYKDIKKKPISKLILSESPIHTTNSSMSTIVKIEFYDKSTKSPTFKIVPNPVNNANASPVSEISPTLKTIPKAVKNTNSSPIANLPEIDLSMPKINIKSSNSNKTDQETNVSSYKSNTTKQKTNVNTMNLNQSISKYTSEQTLKRLATSIFEKFNNVRLEINNERKLLATFSSEAELSKADLAMLDHTLTLAQKEIDHQKLSPGVTFINNLTEADNTTVSTKTNKHTSISNFLMKLNHEDVSSTIIPEYVDKTVNIPKTSCVMSIVHKKKDDMYAEFTSLYYANRIHSLSAFSQIKKEMNATRKGYKSTDLTLTKKPLIKVPSITSNKALFTSLNKTNEHELVTVNRLIDSLVDDIVGNVNPQISNQEQSSYTTSFRVPVQRPLKKPGPVHGVFSKFSQTENFENKDYERVDVFTHKPLKRNHNMADQNTNKRPRVETIELKSEVDYENDENDEHVSNNVKIYEPILFVQRPCNSGVINPNNNHQSSPSKSQVSKETINVATHALSLNPNLASITDDSKNSMFSPSAQVDNKDFISVIPEASSPVQIEHFSQVSENMTFDTDVENLKSLTPVSPQLPVVMSIQPLGDEEILVKQSDDCILGM